MLIIGLIVAFGLFLVGIPICISFGLGASLALILHSGLPFSSVGNLIFDQLAHFSWVAVPLFIFAGNLMVKSKSANAILDFMQSILGHIPGGIAVSAVVSCMFFAALSGSGSATIAAVGTIMIPRMREMGYSDSLSSGVISVAGTLGNLIPPSIFFIIFGMLVEESIAKLFMAGILPGLLVGGIMSIVTIMYAKKEAIHTTTASSWNQIIVTFIKAIPALLIPIVILGGIYGGIFTPTEAAAVACIVALLAGFWYKGISWKTFEAAAFDSLRVTAMLMFLIGTAILLAKVLVLTGLPQIVSNTVADFHLGRILFTLVLSIMLIIFGTFMEGTPMMYVTVPIILPSALLSGVSPIHLGVIYCMAVLIGQVTPPVGIMLYVTSSISGIPAEVVIKGAIPFLIAMVFALVLICLFPQISLFLPGLLMN